MSLNMWELLPLSTFCSLLHGSATKVQKDNLRFIEVVDIAQSV